MKLLRLQTIKNMKLVVQEVRETIYNDPKDLYNTSQGLCCNLNRHYILKFNPLDIGEYDFSDLVFDLTGSCWPIEHGNYSLYANNSKKGLLYSGNNLRQRFALLDKIEEYLTDEINERTRTYPNEQ